MSSEGLVTMRRVAGFCLGRESVTGKGETMWGHIPICLPLYLTGTTLEKPPCPAPDP